VKETVPIQEEEAKEKIKFNIFDNEEEGGNNSNPLHQTMPVLDNVIFDH